MVGSSTESGSGGKRVSRDVGFMERRSTSAFPIATQTSPPTLATVSASAVPENECRWVLDIGRPRVDTLIAYPGQG